MYNILKVTGPKTTEVRQAGAEFNQKRKAEEAAWNAEKQKKKDTDELVQLEREVPDILSELIDALGVKDQLSAETKQKLQRKAILKTKNRSVQKPL